MHFQNSNAPQSITRRRAMQIFATSSAGMLLAGCAGDGGEAASDPLAGAKPPQPQWGDLTSHVRGQVLQRGDLKYENSRTDLVFNARKPRRYPDAIVKVTSVEDVQAAVRFAKQNKLKVTVRGGGHNWNGAAVRDGGIVLDLSQLNDVKIDAANRTAVAQPVVRGRQFTAQLATHGLAFPVGHCGGVPLSGFLLNGGFGWNAGEWGLSCFNVTAMDIVTATGDLVRASDTENADLFWAARGAGPGFFGVVVGYHLKLFELPKSIQTSTLLFPLERVEDVTAWVQQTQATLPPNVEVTMLFTKAPPPVAEKADRVVVVLATVFAKTKEEAAVALKPIADCPLPDVLMKDLGAETPFEKLFDDMDGFFKPGRRFSANANWVAGDAKAVFRTAADQFKQAPSPETGVLALLVPPPPKDAPPMPDASFSMVGPIFINFYSIWTNPADDAANESWQRNATASLSDKIIGHYIGEVDLDASHDRAAKSFAKPNWEKLQTLRAKWDPKGVFHDFLKA